MTADIKERGMPHWVTGEDEFARRAIGARSDKTGSPKTRHIEAYPHDPERAVLRRISRFLNSREGEVEIYFEIPRFDTGIRTSQRQGQTSEEDTQPTYRSKGVLQRVKENPGPVIVGGALLAGELLLSGCTIPGAEVGTSPEPRDGGTTQADTPESTEEFIRTTPESERQRVERELRNHLNEEQIGVIDSVLGSGNVTEEVKQGWTNYLNLLVSEQIEEDTKERAADLMLATFGQTGEGDDVFIASRVVPEVWGEIEAEDEDIGREQVVFRVNGTTAPDEDTGKVVMVVGSKEERRQAKGTMAKFREEAMRVMTPQFGGRITRGIITERETNGEVIYQYTGIVEMGENGEILARTDATGENYIIAYTGEKVILSEGQETVFYTQQSLTGDEEEQIYFDGQPLPELEEGQKYAYDEEANQLQIIDTTLQAPTATATTTPPTETPTPELTATSIYVEQEQRDQILEQIQEDDARLITISNGEIVRLDPNSFNYTTDEKGRVFGYDDQEQLRLLGMEKGQGVGYEWYVITEQGHGDLLSVSLAAGANPHVGWGQRFDPYSDACEIKFNPPNYSEGFCLFSMPGVMRFENPENVWGEFDPNWMQIDAVVQAQEVIQAMPDWERFPESPQHHMENMAFELAALYISDNYYHERFVNIPESLLQILDQRQLTGVDVREVLQSGQDLSISVLNSEEDWKLSEGFTLGNTSYDLVDDNDRGQRQQLRVINGKLFISVAAFTNNRDLEGYQDVNGLPTRAVDGATLFGGIVQAARKSTSRVDIDRLETLYSPADQENGTVLRPPVTYVVVPDLGK